jgi:hypothetical protein
MPVFAVIDATLPLTIPLVPAMLLAAPVSNPWKKHEEALKAPAVPPVVVPPRPARPPFAIMPAKVVSPPSVPFAPFVSSDVEAAPPIPGAPITTASVALNLEALHSM